MSALISVVVPVYNERESLPILIDEIEAAMTAASLPFEIVCVDDGSRDGSAEILDALAAAKPFLVVVHFKRNCGQTAALMAGVDHSKGDIIAPLDADQQNDPRDIPKLVAKLNEGFDVVSGWRRQRQDLAWRRVFPSRVANWLISKVTGVALHDYGCSLKAYRRSALEGVRLYGELHRFVPVFVRMQGGRIAEAEVNHRPRKYGSSKYGLERIGKVILDLMLVKFLASYAQKPIYVFGGFGLASLLFSLLPMGLAVFFKLMPRDTGLHKDFVESPLPVFAAVFLVAGCLGILLGLQAEILMRTYHEAQDKPTYLVDRVVRHPGAG